MLTDLAVGAKASPARCHNLVRAAPCRVPACTTASATTDYALSPATRPCMPASTKCAVGTGLCCQVGGHCAGSDTLHQGPVDAVRPAQDTIIVEHASQTGKPNFASRRRAADLPLRRASHHAAETAPLERDLLTFVVDVLAIPREHRKGREDQLSIFHFIACSLWEMGGSPLV